MDFLAPMASMYLLLLSSNTCAENASNNTNSTGSATFKDEFFTPKKNDGVPAYSEGPITGTKRAVDLRVPRYNQAQRERAELECSEETKKDPRKGGECVQAKLKQFEREAEEKIDDYQKRKKLQLRNKKSSGSQVEALSEEE